MYQKNQISTEFNPVNNGRIRIDFSVVLLLCKEMEAL